MWSADQPRTYFIFWTQGCRRERCPIAAVPMTITCSPERSPPKLNSSAPVTGGSGGTHSVTMPVSHWHAPQLTVL
jgi:hypothetical protein